MAVVLLSVDKFEKHAHLKGMKIEFHIILKELMKKRGLNQQQIADLLGIRQSQVSNWLNAHSLPGYFSLKLLCEKLKIPATDLF
jgi:transcriptional regulator with XRE-family HTH domain